MQEEDGAADSGVGVLKDVTPDGDLCAGMGIGVLQGRLHHHGRI